jgi:pimeloyl-ACP methyl ester carboxylesterase
MAVAVAAVIALALTGCTAASTPRPTSQRPASQARASVLSRFYDQKLKWSLCGEFQCTKAIVPLDWSKPGGKTISVAMNRAPAESGTSKGYILYDPGGPGGSGMDYVAEELDAGYLFDKKVQADYSIVGIDPRGVDHSTAVACYSNSQLRHYYYDVLPGAIGSTEWLAADRKRQADFAKACAHSTGSLLGQVDTVSAARDLDVLRAALGEKKLNYLGDSWGTKLGLTYAGLFPKKVGRLVLDAVLQPDLTGQQIDVQQAAAFEDELQQYLADCLKDTSTCPFAGGVADADSQLTALFAAMDAHPLPGSHDRKLNGTNLAQAVLSALYAPFLWPVLSKAVKSVQAGSATQAFALADEYYEIDAAGHYSNIMEDYSANQCLDANFPQTDATMEAEAAVIDATAPVLGPYFSYVGVLCAEWPYAKKADAAQPITAAGSGPILLVSATHDPATPLIWAQNSVAQLANGHLITRNGDGHGSYDTGNDCIDSAVDNYFLHGTVPASDPHC